MDILQKYAHLLVNYSLQIQKGDRLFIQTTTLAEPLVREVFRAAYQAGASLVETDMAFRGRNKLLLDSAHADQLHTPPPLYDLAMREFEAYLHIKAPFNLREDQNIDGTKAKIRNKALQAANDNYFARTATRSLKRNLCLFPTDASAQEAGMSLEEYEKFVFGACKLFENDPTQAWLNVRKNQQRIVDRLNAATKIQYKGEGIDISFSTKGRIWINSDGQTNMPSGEVYTSPVEDSVNGKVHFTFPCLYGGHEVQNVTLWVKDGYIERWEAQQGKEYLDYIFTLEGTRRFGEIAIGTNYDIKQMTKNILFDEKIGGTIHMAIGQSYLQTGGKNQSPVHWDMITDMTHNGGEIWADGEKIYQNGVFLI